MIPVEEIKKSLPPLRDDEPSSLRQDIVDEILDHLQCTLRRELFVAGGDELTAKQRVLEKFGDPQQIARKLWFQAMWSKIMTQRLVICSTICSMLVSVAVVVIVALMLQQMQQQQRDQQLVSAALIEQMGRLARLPNVPQAQRDLRWNSLKVKVTAGSKGGLELDGFTIRVMRLPGIGEVKNGAQFDAKIDKSGVTDCGYVEPGRYEVDVMTPWGEETRTTCTVQPGRDHVEHIVAPEHMPALTRVVFDVDALPTEADFKGFVFAVAFKPIGSRPVAEQAWAIQSWKSMPVLLMVPKHGIWVSNIAGEAENWPDATSWQETIRTANWKLLDSKYEISLPTHEYTVAFLLVSGQANVSPDDEKWLEGGPVFFGPYHRLGSQDSIKFAAESGRLNEWKMQIPEHVVKLLSNPPQMGGGFF